EKEGNYKKYNNYVRRIVSIISQVERQRPSFVEHVIKQAVIALGKIGATEYVGDLLKASEFSNSFSITPDLLITLGKIGSSKEIIAYANRVLNVPSPIEHKISAAWCIGKIGSRTRTPPLKAEFLSESINLLIEELKKHRNNMKAKTYFTFALGLVGNSSVKDQKITDKDTLKLNDALLVSLGKNYFERQKTENYVQLQRLDNKVASIALKLVGGEEILPEEKSLMEELEPVF
ncbi:MAG: HEAT repeat domain-containing protein, partial [Candidatus Heimdallarchaeaceae archaeon]